MVVSHFRELGYDIDGVNPVQIALPPQEREIKDTLTGYLLQNDIFISTSYLKNAVQQTTTRPHARLSQYTANYVVNSLPRTIRVLGYSGFWAPPGFSLTTEMKKGLERAVRNYNNLGLGLTFTLAYGTSTEDYDIVVFRTFADGKVEGSAGIPQFNSEGAINPYKWVALYSPLSDKGNNRITRTIMHEIGHCLGLRHSDWYDTRVSCGQGNGGQQTSLYFVDGQPIGYFHVPGTPIDAYDDLSSVMTACAPLDVQVTGEFSAYDKATLQYLFPRY